MIASSLAESINPQVLITITSAFVSSFTISNLFFLNIPMVTYVSIKFLLHPNDINPTFIVSLFLPPNSYVILSFTFTLIFMAANMFSG